MENFNDLLRKYANLVIKKGVNIQENGLLFINSPIECASFARLLAEEAFKASAKDVYINYSDELFTRIRFENASEETLSSVPQYEIDKYNYFTDNGASFISISANDPSLFKGIDSKKISAASKARSLALRNYSDKLMNNENAWCVISMPTKAWASKVFNNVSEDEAVEKLFEAIFNVMRLNSKDPITEWTNHSNNLKSNMKKLQDYDFDKLIFKNTLGTNLELSLAPNHIWCGGSDFTKNGVEFIANMPTEEIFTTPKRNGINGIVYSTKPLNYGGNLINNFSFTFKDGKIIDFTAEEGYDSLKELLDTDEGSRYLGEVALVPYNSPISNSNILFFNTLFDENASCHLAIGKAYPSCIKNGEEMNDEELLNAESNVSLTHVDFMIGSKDLNIVGITKDGTEIQVFKDGNFAL
ncbi:aminopeptidase [Clostridium sp. Ade.TY]|uniref:aminopeptidase n=1 Tax=Clostridium sp. Ade.TY TaxID=1391647 RepID=UPI0003FCF5C3|nr:aminopeptidase [Clostridium sp. Ade.TY]